MNTSSHPSLGSILLHGGDLQHLSWLGLQWTLLNQRPALRSWLQQLFPLRNLETSKLDSNAPESICLLDLEVQEIMCGLPQLVEAFLPNWMTFAILFFPKISAAPIYFFVSIQVFLYGVVFCSHCQLQETVKLSGGMNQQRLQQLYEPRCLALPLLRLLTTERQREWWNAIYSLIHRQAAWVSWGHTKINRAAYMHKVFVDDVFK